MKACKQTTYHNTQPFYSPFSGTTRVSQCWKKSASGLYGAREDNSGRHTDHPAGRHCIWTNQRPPPSSPHFTGGMPFVPPSQQCQSTEGTGNGKLIFTENKITSEEKKSSIWISCNCACIEDNHLLYSVAAESDAGQYNCSFTFGTPSGHLLTFTESIEVTGKSVLIVIC